MQIKRVITAEGKGRVAIQTDTINTDAIKYLSNIWGFDRIPTLPLTAAEVLGEYQKKGVFGPHGSVRFHYVVSKPETGEGPSLEQLAASLDMGIWSPARGGSGFSINLTVAQRSAQKARKQATTSPATRSAPTRGAWDSSRTPAP